MATRFWTCLEDFYSDEESEEELDDIGDSFELNSEQADSLHGTKYEELNKNTMTHKIMKHDRQRLDILSKSGMDDGCRDDVDGDTFSSGSEAECEIRNDGFEEWKSLRDRYLKMCEEIEVDATFDGKRINIPDNNRKFELLKSVGATPTHMIEVFLTMIGDHLSTMSALPGVDPCFIGHMPFKAWKKTLEDLYVVLEILKGSGVVVGRNKGLKCFKGKTVVYGNLIEMLETIDIQLFLRLQCVDLGPQELVEVLRNEYLLYDLSQKFQQYFVSIKHFKSAARCALIRMGIIYYKNKDMYNLMREVVSVEYDVRLAASPGFGTYPLTFPVNCRELMDDVASFISKHGGERIKTHATLCNIYNLAVMDQYLEAVNVLCDSGLLLRRYMSLATQILFNRTMAQLGLCSFRGGYIEKAHTLLYKFHGGEWAKKLLKLGVPGKSLPR